MDRGGGDPLPVPIAQLDLAGELDLALGVEGGKGLGGVDSERRRRRDLAVGDLFVGDLGRAGEGRDVAHPLREGADESRARGGLGGGKEGACMLGADVVFQLRPVGQENRRLPRGDLGDLDVEVPGEGNRLRHPFGDQVEVGHRLTLSRDQRPWNSACPGPPCSRKVRTAFCRSSLAKSSPASVRTASSAAGIPPSRKRRRMCLVIACAFVGPDASSSASLREAASKSWSSKSRLTTPQRSISSAPKIPPDITK